MQQHSDNEDMWDEWLWFAIRFILSILLGLALYAAYEFIGIGFVLGFLGAAYINDSLERL